MKHIKTLILKNFQQWKEGVIEFKSGLNVIIGNTESGKSTLFRAISSIITGKMPEDYIRKESNGAEVKIEFEDKSIFRRIRNKKENIADANGKVFERVGKDIPFDYFKELGSSNIEFGDKKLSLCLYNQFEPHFFITLSDYDKSKIIGTICGIDTVDKLVDNINKDIRQSNSNIKYITQQIELLQDDFNKKNESFNALKIKKENSEKIFNDLDKKFKLLEKYSKTYQDLIFINNQINIYQNELNKNNSVLNKINSDSIIKLQKLLNIYIKNETIKNDIEYIKTTININNNIINCELDIDNFERINNLSNKLTNINDDINKVNSEIKILDSEIEFLIKSDKELLKDYDRCPLCGGTL